jgi:hypothetical protein
MGFASVAHVRGPHWIKTVDECSLVGTPLAEYLNTLPIAQAKKIQQVMLPFSIAMGCLVLVSGPLAVEKQLHESKHSSNSPRTEQTTGSVEFNQAATNYGASNGSVAVRTFEDDYRGNPVTV